MNRSPFPIAITIAIDAQQAAPRAKLSNYPEPFFSRMLGRTVRPLGDVFGLANFGVNLATLVENRSWHFTYKDGSPY